MDDGRYRSGPKVLYIGGTGRTGSTLLTRLLGEVPGWFAGGELAFLWRFGLGAEGRCSCGAAVRACPIWSDAFSAVEAGGVEIDPDRMVALRRRCWSGHLPQMLASPRLASWYLDRLEEYPAVVEATYRAVADRAGSQVIVDSSKEPHYSWILRDRTDLDVYFLHLVRDPRAVAHSWSRTRAEHGFRGLVEMGRRGPLRSSLYYDVSNVAAERIWGGSARYAFLRYEDLIAQPAEALRAVADFVGESIESPLDGASFDAAPQHVAWGNPNRFDGGRIHLRPDVAWLQDQSPLSATTVRLATAPVAGRYGYPWRRREPEPFPRSPHVRSADLLSEMSR